MKRRQVLLVVIVVLLLVTVTLSQLAIGNFNAATGFSGRHGFTCTSCHNVPDMGPLGGDEVYDEPATVSLAGLPEEWHLNGTHTLTITVTGGPPAAPSPAPQGGFEIEADQGTFSVTAGMEDFTDVYAEDGGAVTYTAEGTQMREWQVDWHAPALDRAPAPVTFWVAAMAANGNHVVAAEQSDGGEFGDSVDNITVTVPPSQAATEAWEAIRILRPVVDGAPPSVPAFTAFSITGEHADPDATHLGYSLDGGPWERKATPGTTWRLDFGNGLTPGDHTLLVRSETDARVSEPVTMEIHVDDEALDDVNAPVPFLVAVGALLLAAGWRRKR